jgi:hypothetical protein
MREIVADTAPLNYLVLIEAAGILPRLFASVLIPPAVKKELSHGNAPAAVSTWLASQGVIDRPEQGRGAEEHGTEAPRGYDRVRQQLRDRHGCHQRGQVAGNHNQMIEPGLNLSRKNSRSYGPLRFCG